MESAAPPGNPAGQKLNENYRKLVATCSVHKGERLDIGVRIAGSCSHAG